MSAFDPKRTCDHGLLWTAITNPRTSNKFAAMPPKGYALGNPMFGIGSGKYAPARIAFCSALKSVPD